MPYDYRVLLPGHSDELAYDLGLIEAKGSFEETKAAAKVNFNAYLYRDDPDFSRKIRGKLSTVVRRVGSGRLGTIVGWGRYRPTLQHFSPSAEQLRHVDRLAAVGRDECLERLVVDLQLTPLAVEKGGDESLG